MDVTPDVFEINYHTPNLTERSTDTEKESELNNYLGTSD